MIRFGTDGIRGVAGVPPCTVETALALGRAVVHLGSEVLIGRDTRVSGPALASALAAGVAAAGGTARLAGVVPTPCVASALAEGVGQAGVMVTASHNPAPDNGFKVFGAGGRKLSDAQTEAIELALAGDPVHGAPGGVESVDLIPLYGERLARTLGALRNLEGRRVAVDVAAGAGTAMLPWLRTLPVEWVVVGERGVINEGVGSEHPGALARAVLEKGCVGGFAIDGDGDRCRLVDEAGIVVPGDALTWLLARHMGVSSIAVTVMSNAALESALPGVHVHRTPVGDRHIIAAMERHGLALGAEESGHVLFADFGAGDGLLTGLRGLDIALGQGSISGATAEFEPFPRRVTKVRVRARPPLDTVAPLVAAQHDAESTLGQGRVFLRYSGTEPVLRILVEGRDDGAVDRASEQVTRVATEVLA